MEQEQEQDQEKLFAIKLADEDRSVREKCLVKMRNYLKSRCVTKDFFSKEELIKIWKGLHYSMWMCDKPIIQEELSHRISDLINCFETSEKQVMLFIKVYYITISREWNGIDKWRMDKFMMMMRDMLKKIFAYLNSKNWKKSLVKSFNKIMLKYPLNINDYAIPDGVSYHTTDVYLEELVKFGEKLKPIRAVKMLRVFIKLLAISTKKAFVTHIYKRVFLQIIECSDVGIDPEVEEELENIKPFGLQRDEVEDTTEYTIKFNYEKISDSLFKVANSSICLERNKKVIYDLVKKFRALSKGCYPIDDFNFQPLYDEPKQKPAKKAKKSKKLSNKKLVSK